MSEKKIIQFDTASQVESDAYVPITQMVNGNQKTLKALIDQLGAYISRVQQYNDLDTTAKDLIGAINEAAESGSVEMEQTVTTPVSIASINDGGDNIPVKSLKVLVSAVQSGSGTPSPSNIRSISGWSGANVSSTGKNLFNSNNIHENSIQAWATGGLVAETGSYVTDYIPVVEGQTYICNKFISQLLAFDRNRNYVFVYKNGSWVSPQTGSTLNTSFTIPSGVSYIRITRRSIDMSGATIAEDSSSLQLELGSSATTYEPFGTTHTIPFGQTVYGGLLDVTKGVLTITHGIVDLGTLSYTQINHQTFGAYYYADVQSLGFKRQRDFSQAYNNICEEYAVVGRNIYDFVDFTLAHDGNASAVTQVQVKNSNCADAMAMKTALNGVNLVYELATPTTIYLTPTQVKTLLTCNIFADTGDIDTLIYFNSNADETADVVEAYVGDVVNLYATLATGNTSVTISSSAIHTNSTIDIYTDNDVDYISAVVTEGQIVITFDAQASDLGVKVRVS